MGLPESGNGIVHRRLAARVTMLLAKTLNNSRDRMPLLPVDGLVSG